ncbi:MAG: hypothetical protein IJ428_06950 [Clostridia bacterium]|nr:hypothetical protein [Clostridia bacterium]
MKPINNYESIQASTDEFARPVPGGYIIVITGVKDVPLDPVSGKGEYLNIQYDFAAGDFKGYHREMSERFGFWGGSFIRSYKEKAVSMFKHFTNCIEESNPGYKWDFNEVGLIGRYLGIVLGEEEYLSNKDNCIKTRLAVKAIKTPKQIQEGDFKVPPIKRLDGAPGAAPTVCAVPAAAPQNAPRWETINDSELPF